MTTPAPRKRTSQTTSLSTADLPLADRTSGLVGSIIDSSTSLLAAQSHDIVRFAMGSPAPEAIPTGALAKAAADELPEGKADAYDYAATEGDAPLRVALCEALEKLGEPTDLERITITSGGMQGLDLACKLFVDPGDVVAIEGPTYTNGSGTALSYQADLLEVPVDKDGMQVDVLEREVNRTGKVPTLIYTVPTFQNPSGATMSLERRLRLLELAREWGSMVLDDDPYGLLRFEGESIPSIKELADGDPQVFAVRTFSKIIAPGLRVGWIDSDPGLQSLLINAKQAMDTCTNLPSQRLVTHFLRSGALQEHLDTVRPEYRRRKIAMQQALTEHFSDIAEWTDPEGGFFLWVSFGEDVNTEELFEIALAEGVAYIPGNAFSPGRNFPNDLRLCFATSTPERIAEGIARLRAAVDRARA